jgi:hypothetical protein
MGYVIAAIIVLLLVAGFVTFFVLDAARRSGGAGPRDPGAEGHPAGIAAPDESPLGDTAEHSGATRHEGRSEGAGLRAAWRPAALTRLGSRAVGHVRGVELRGCPPLFR